MVPGQAWGEPVDCPGGVRRGGGASLVQAPERNVRTCSRKLWSAGSGDERETPKRQNPQGAEYRCRVQGRTAPW